MAKKPAVAKKTSRRPAKPAVKVAKAKLTKPAAKARKARPTKPSAKATKARPSKPSAKARKARPTKSVAKARPSKSTTKARKARPSKQSTKATKARPSKSVAKVRKPAVPKSPRRQKVRVLADEPPETKTYMSAKQLDWFRGKLESMLDEIKAEAEKTAQGLRDQEKGLADEVDRAHSEFAFVVDLRENERIGNLQLKINHVLRQIDNGTYGYCDDCGAQIGMRRMTARPVATKCIDCKQFQEQQERSV